MQVERRKKLLARVGKLIAQAEGTPYKEEAQVAYTMAQKILLENGLTMSEVDALMADEQRKLVANSYVDSMISSASAKVSEALRHGLRVW
jgi:hypothetical protein